MERLMNIWNDLGTWMDANFDKPMYQHVTGIILGMVLGLCLITIIKGIKGEHDGQE